MSSLYAWMHMDWNIKMRLHGLFKIIIWHVRQICDFFRVISDGFVTKKTVQYIVFDAIESFQPEATTPMGPRGMEITHSFIRQDN